MFVDYHLNGLYGERAVLIVYDDLNE
jgi:hypothetical protein